jgi:hypothetical protein
MVVCFQTLSFSKIDNHVLFFQNLTAELILHESPDDSYFLKSGGSNFLKSAETKLLLSGPRSHFTLEVLNSLTGLEAVGP